MRLGLTYTGTPEKHANYVRWLQGGAHVVAGDGAGRDGGRQADDLTGDADDAVRDGVKSAVEGIEVIRLSAEDGNLDALAGCDGLVLSGGVDIHPDLYGGGMEYERGPVKGWERERDDFEKAVLEKAWENGLPVLGVCRGLQLINICCKGTLVQDLGPEKDETHQNKGPVDMMHAVRLEPGSLLEDIAKKGGSINSAHHQAIDRLGQGLRVNCRSEDGTIEGIEWADPAGKSFLIAVQWHPERMFTNGLPDVWLYAAIRDRYLQEIRKNKAAK